MEKKTGGVKILLSLLFILAVLHFSFHFVLFGSGVAGFYESGISGFSIGKLELGEEIKTSYRPISPVSLGIIIAEWAFLIFGILFTITKGRYEKKQERVNINLEKYRSSTKTDLDILYDILKEKKHLHISTIAKLFKVNTSLATSWAKTLEEGNLADINKPRMGETTVSIR